MADTERCAAKTRKGSPCRHEAGWGTQHPGIGRCKLHGGSEPRAQVNGLIELARREQTVMGAPVHISPQDAILECIAIAAGEVRYASERVAGLDDADAVGPLRSTLARKDSDGATISEVRQGPPTLHVWIQVRERALDRLMGYTAAALKLKLDERLVRVAEGQAAMLATAVRGILTDLGVQDHPEAPQIVRRHLTLLAGESVSAGMRPAGSAAA